jgi:hypothetical protein
MTQIAPSAVASSSGSTPPTGSAGAAPALGRNPQRDTLEQIVKLSIESSAEERRIEQEHTDALARENSGHRKTSEGANAAYEQRVEAQQADAQQREEAIEGAYASGRQSLDEEHERIERQIGRKKAETENAIKKQTEQAAWQAESQLVSQGMRLDTEEQKEKGELEASLGKLNDVQRSAREALTRAGLEGFAPDSAVDQSIKTRAETEAATLLSEHQQKAETDLQELRSATSPRVMGDIVAVFLVIVLSAGAGAAGWALSPEQDAKLWAAGGAGLGMLVLGLIVWGVVKLTKKRRMRARARDLYTSVLQSSEIARYAGKSQLERANETRERKVFEARRKRDLEIKAAKEKGRTQLQEAAEQHRAALAAEAKRYDERLAALDRDRAQGLAALNRERDETAKKTDAEHAAASAAAVEAHGAAMERIEREYREATAKLAARWDEGLRAVKALLAAGSGIDPALVDWNSPAWDHWKSPTEYAGQVRFGEMQVNLAELTEHVPQRLELPGTFTVPALLTMPVQASLLIDTDHAGRSAALDVVQTVMARLLTQIPAGRVKFTLFDPVGLGQSFAGFMHLADHDESLVGSRIWTEKEHMNQRLADLTEHMETVIQKYLRNEYATIDEYNAQAGELAEPIRYLVLADFPTGFEQDTLRRLSSIALTGPRCGVYTIILRDLRQPLPQGTRMEDILARSVHLVHKAGGFVWDDAVFKRFPLKVDAPPDEKALTRLMDQVGKAAKEAKRVEVPFESIAPPEGQFWSQTSQSDVRVPIGKSGATRLQALRLGVGVAQHVLVAGKTGSGKSNLMHTIVTNLAMWYGPDEIEFYLVDFKKGVEFKAYASSELPHARAIAVESDREFGLSVLQRVDAELTRRGNMFRDVGAQEIGAFREKTGQKLPRTILLIDEFQEFFSEDDKLAQEAAGLLDRLVRQGRAFGVHVVLGSQTIGGSSGLARSTLGQIAVRVALQCTEADSQLILGDNNGAARLLTRPGEAVYNDAGGLVEANSPFQIAFLPDDQREEFLDRVHTLAQKRKADGVPPIVFEGNSAASIRKNHRLMTLLERPAMGATSTVLAYVGEPVAIKEPTAIAFRRQGGANVLMVGQQEESAIGIAASTITSIAAQQKPGDAVFYILDGTPADSKYFGVLERTAAALPHESKIVSLRDTPDAINELAKLMAARQGDETQAGPSVYLILFGLQRYRMLRKQEDDFSFSRGGEEAPPKPDKQLAELLSEGPGVGIHTIIWADAPVTLERTLDRGSMRQFDHRVLFQMSASDSSNLIDSPLANRLGGHRALLYSEEQGTTEKFRPYEVPDAAWLDEVHKRLAARGK